jgi:hypothetical protein
MAQTKVSAKLVYIAKSSDWTGRRLYLGGHRIHHGLTGILFTCLGVILAVHDRHDWKVWIRDLWNEMT